jgi:SAM-dependent methyltransferase
MSHINDEAVRLTGERIGFSFGDNWKQFLAALTPEKIAQAESSLTESFHGAPLEGQSFLDIGCGSGLFSLAARRQGALVTSVDVDPASVECAERLRAHDAGWTVRRASVLTDDLPSAQRVYSWGVLHHTGAMWEAVGRALNAVAPGGLACIALYKTPVAPRTQMALKRLYNRSPQPGRRALRLLYGTTWLVARTLRRRTSPFVYIRDYGKTARGMSFWRDVEDWLGGLPIEYTEPREFKERLPAGFEVTATIERGPGACTEYLVRRS